MKRLGRPSGGNGFGIDVDERKSAIGLLEQRFYYRQTKHDGAAPAEPSFSSAEIAEAQTAIKGLHTLLHSTSIDVLPLDQRKALSAFALGSQGFLLAPEMSQQILSCLVDATDITGLMNNVTISSSGIKFLVDNEAWDVAAWACDTSCFANNPTQHLGDGLGELEIKPESLRYIVCATRDLLEDSGTNVEQWIFDKTSRAFRAQISNAIMVGDGFGKPMGILNPNAGIPICETADGTPEGMFTWQDLAMLRWQVPMSYQDSVAFVMNQNTWALCTTISDANGRPIMIPIPLMGQGQFPGGAQFLLLGVPVIIATQMPDVAPGATPVAVGNWRQTYMVVNRKGVTMQQDPYSAGFCVLFKAEARIGGSVICPNAARLLRVR